MPDKDGRYSPEHIETMVNNELFEREFSAVFGKLSGICDGEPSTRSVFNSCLCCGLVVCQQEPCRRKKSM